MKLRCLQEDVKKNKISPPISRGALRTSRKNLSQKVNEKYSIENPMSSEISQAPVNHPSSPENQSKNLYENEVSKDYLDIRANLNYCIENISCLTLSAMAEILQINCGGSYFVRECGCKEDNPRIEKMHGCMNENCISCADDVKFRRTKRCIERLNAKRYTSPVLYTNFTVPPELRKKVYNRVVWDGWIKSMLGVLKEKYGLYYAFGSSHPISEKNPNIFHPHWNLIWIQKTGFNAFLDDQQLKELKEAWKNIIGAERVVDVFHIYNRNESVIFKWVSYVVRPFPGWKFWRGKAVRWYGKYPREGKDYKTEKYDMQDEICEKCGQKIRRWLIRDYLHGERRYKSGFT